MRRRQADVLGLATPDRINRILRSLSADPDLQKDEARTAIRIYRYGPGLRAMVRRVARPGESETACLRRCIADDIARSGPDLADPRLLRYIPGEDRGATVNRTIPLSLVTFTGVRHRARILKLGQERYVNYVMTRADWIVAHGGEIPDDPEVLLRADWVRY